jgi:VanZ family protein
MATGTSTSETRFGAALGVISTALIAVVTLRGETVFGPPPGPTCYLCEGIQLSDVVRNVVLYLPLGASMTLVGMRARWVTVLALALSVTIEYVQLHLPGRESSLADVVCNGSGALLGVVAARHWERWLRPSAQLGAWLSLGAAAATAVVVALTGWLVMPAYTSTTWYAGWVPELGHLGVYRGHVQALRIGDVPLPGGRIADTDTARELLRAGAPLHVSAVMGPAPERLAPLVTVHDAERNEMLIVGAEGGDLIYRQRTHGAELGLEQPSIRLPGALSHQRRGTPIEIEVRRTTPDRAEDGICISINGTERCGLGYSAGRGWALFFRIRDVAWGGRRLLDGFWIAALCLPVALWWQPRGPGFAALVVVSAAVLVLPGAVGLVAPRLAELWGLLLGLVLGMGFQRSVRRSG